jgi:3-oxoacyl-[acyl-carrier-protein] synthase II
MTRQAVITGIGVVLPDTNSLDGLWECQSNRRTHIKRLTPGLYGSRIDEALIEGRLTSRLSRKLDAFTRYALVAAQSAIDDAALDMDAVDRNRCGVFVGNSFGGWQFTELQLRNLHCEGPRAVSPFQATSWFPAAPQGQMTILHGIKGFSKTYMADRASSLLSVSSAANLIRRGELDVAIAGGTESTNTDFVHLALENLSASGHEPDSANAFAISEGAVFLILEDAERATRRGARIYAQVGDFAMLNAPCDADRYSTDPHAMIRSMQRVCANELPDLIMPDACGIGGPDRAETQALCEVLEGIPLTVPKARYGHTFGAEGALSIAYACLMFRKEQVLPTTTELKVAPPPFVEMPNTALSARRVERILINACATGGAASSLMLTKGN